MASQIAELKEKLKRKNKFAAPIPAKRFVSSGSTPLNLACSGRPTGAFAKGKIYLFVGDTDSGKSWLSFTCLAEASINKYFDDYDLIYDNLEDGADFDWATFFGPKAAKRIMPPKGTKEQPEYSKTVEEFYSLFEARCRRVLKGEAQPFIWVLDSQDALDCDARIKKASKKFKAREKGEDEGKGSYGTDKARAHSQGMPMACAMCRDTGSILIIVNQSRMRIGMGAMFDPRTRSGGTALEFYSNIQLWTKVKEKLRKDHNGKKRRVGTAAEVHIKRSRFTGRERKVVVHIYNSHGIDDVRSCIDFLVDEKHWKGTRETVQAPEFKFKGTKEKLIRLIERKNDEQKLRDLVSKVWDEIEEALVVVRKNKYHSQEA